MRLWLPLASDVMMATGVVICSVAAASGGVQVGGLRNRAHDEDNTPNFGSC